MDLQDYINKVNSRYQTGITTEHSFRGDLQNLLESILPKDIQVTSKGREISRSPQWYRNVVNINHLDCSL